MNMYYLIESNFAASLVAIGNERSRRFRIIDRLDRFKNYIQFPEILIKNVFIIY